MRKKLIISILVISFVFPAKDNFLPIIIVGGIIVTGIINSISNPPPSVKYVKDYYEYSLYNGTKFNG